MKTKAAAALLLVLFTLVIYSNSLGGEFVYDDEYFVVKNIAIRSLENVPLFFVSPSAVAFAELSRDVYRPLTTLTFAIDYSLWKLDAFGYHLVNAILHALNAALLFLLLVSAFGDAFLAFVTAMLFACHPVQTEAVSWISGRSSVLFLFFYLLAMAGYLLYRKKGAIAYFAGSLIAFSASLLSKEMAVTLPLVLMAYDAHFNEDEPFRRRFFRSYAPYIIVALLFVLARSEILRRVGQCGWWGGSPYHTFLTMSQALVDYIKVMLWPSGLNAFRVSGVVTSIADPRAVFSLAVLAAVFAALPFAYRHARGISFAVWWFFITLLPVSNIVPIRAVMAERFLYLPSIGFCLLAAICIERIGLIGSGKGDKPGAEPAAGEKAAPACGRLSVFARMAAVSVTAVLIIACSARTMIRNEDWKDAVSITRSILKIDPLNPWAFTSLGAAYSGQERHQEAVKPLLKAIALSGTYFAPRNILGFSYLEMGRFDEAIKVLEGALKINPDSLEALNSLGVAYASVGRYKDAVKQFERSIKIDGTFANAYVNLGTTYDRMGRPDKALEAYGMVESITRSKQDIAIACIRMGDVYMKTGRRDRAREYYAKAAGLCGRGMDELKRIAVERQRR